MLWRSTTKSSFKTLWRKKPVRGKSHVLNALSTLALFTYTIWLTAQSKYSLLRITLRESHLESMLSSYPIDRSRNLQQGGYSGRLSKRPTIFTIRSTLCTVISNLTTYYWRKALGWSNWSILVSVCWWLNNDSVLKFFVVHLVTWHQKSLASPTMRACLSICGPWVFYCMWCWRVLSHSEAQVSKTCTRESKEASTVTMSLWIMGQPRLSKDCWRSILVRELKQRSWWRSPTSCARMWGWRPSRWLVQSLAPTT